MLVETFGGLGPALVEEHGRRKIRSDCGWAPSGECVATVGSVGAVSVRACMRP